MNIKRRIISANKTMQELRERIDTAAKQLNKDFIISIHFGRELSVSVFRPGEARRPIPACEFLLDKDLTTIKVDHHFSSTEESAREFLREVLRIASQQLNEGL